MKDTKSIYNYYKAAIKLRNIYPVIARGVTEPIEELADKDISCYIKKEKQNGEFETGSLLFLINISDEAREVDLGKSTEAVQYTELAYSLNATEAVSTIDGEVVTVPAFGIAVLTKK
jgi:glycosidase